MMNKKFSKTEIKGLPGGPNEQFTYVTGVFLQDMYHAPIAQIGLEVESENDARYKSYKDSVNLYNAMIMQDRLMGYEGQPSTYNSTWTKKDKIEGRKRKPLTFGDGTIVRKDDGTPFYTKPDFGTKREMFGPNLDQFTEINRPEDLELINYYQSLGFTDDDIMYHGSPDIVSDKIKAIGSYFDGTAHSPIYPRPKYPVYVKGQKPIKLLKNTKTYLGDLTKNIPQPSYRIHDYMKMEGMDPSFENRSMWAKMFGIGDYKGTAKQNIELIEKLQEYKKNPIRAQKGLEKYQTKGEFNEKKQDKSKREFIKYYNDKNIKYLKGTQDKNPRFRNLSPDELQQFSALNDYEIFTSSLGQNIPLGRNRRFGIEWDDGDEYTEIPKDNPLWKEIYKENKKDYKLENLINRLKKKEYTGKRDYKLTPAILNELEYLQSLKEGDKDFFRKGDTDVLENIIKKEYNIDNSKNPLDLRKRKKFIRSPFDYALELSKNYISNNNELPFIKQKGGEGYRINAPNYNDPYKVIPSGNITMTEKDGGPLKKGPLLGIDNLGNQQMMFPGYNYVFPGDMVMEIPVMQKGNGEISFFNRAKDAYKQGMFLPFLEDRVNESLDGTMHNNLPYTEQQKKLMKEVHDAHVAMSDYEHELYKLLGSWDHSKYNKEQQAEYQRLYDDFYKKRNSKEYKQFEKEVLDFRDENSDALRHTYTSAMTAQKIRDKVRENAPFLKYLGADRSAGFIGANLLGIGHELSVFADDDRPFMTKLQESGKDIYNNFIGSLMGVGSTTPEAAAKYSENAVRKGWTTSGYVEEEKQKGGLKKAQYLNSQVFEDLKKQSKKSTGVIEQAEEVTLPNRILNAMAQPMTYRANKNQGINSPYVIGLNPFDIALAYVNPTVAFKTGKNAIEETAKGNYGNALLNAAYTASYLPYLKALPLKQKGGTSWTDYLNPFNWGAKNMDKVGDFQTAFRTARGAGYDDFMWQGDRYSTELAEQPNYENLFYDKSLLDNLSDEQKQRREALLYNADLIAKSQGDNEDLRRLLIMTAAMENSLGANPKAYGRDYTRGPMSIDNIAWRDVFDVREGANNYTAQQNKNEKWLNSLGLDMNNLETLLRSDDPLASMAVARLVYGRIPEALPSGDDPKAMFDYYLNYYNRKGLLKHGTPEQHYARFLKDYNRIYKKSGGEFQRLVDKYTTKGWNSLTDTEKQEYKNYYNNM